MIDSDGRGTCGEGQRIGDVENDSPEDYEDWAKGAPTTLPQTGVSRRQRAPMSTSIDAH